MLAIPFDEIIKKICEKTNVTEKLVLDKIAAKKKELSGLVSDEGAAFIIASEMNVDVIGSTASQKLKIADVLVGMRSVSVTGRVLQIFDTKEFATKEGKKGKFCAFLIGDETGKVRIVVWNDQVKLLEKISRGSAVRVTGTYSRENKFSGVELHMGIRSTLDIVEDTGLPAVDEFNVQKSQDTLRGVIVQAYRPNFYDVCPTCNNAAKEGLCKEHGAVTPNKAMLINIVIDDGVKCMRCVAFKDVAEKIAGMNVEGAKKIVVEKSEAALNEQVEEFLHGKFVEAGGKIRHNEAFDRDEMIINNINLDLSAEQILKERGK